MKGWKKICLSLIILLACGCAKTVSLNDAANISVEGLPTGHVRDITSKAQPVAVKFNYNKTSGIAIEEYYFDKDIPNQEVVDRVLKNNLDSYKQSGFVEDFLFINPNGEYSCLYCSGKKNNKFLSVFYESEQSNIIGATFKTALLPLSLLSSKGGDVDTPKLTEQAVSSKRVLDIGRVVEAKFMEYIDRNLTGNDVETLIYLSENFDKHPSAISAKAKAVSQLRAMNTFDGYKRAFEVTNQKVDFDKMGDLARSQTEKRQYESMAVLIAKNKNDIFDVTISGTSGNLETGDASGFIVLSKKFGILNYVLTVTVAEKRGLGLEFPYEIDVEVGTKAKRKCFLRSNFLGNKDYTDEVISSQILTFIVTPNSTATKKVKSAITAAYADRGLMNGTTQCDLLTEPVHYAVIKSVRPQ